MKLDALPGAKKYTKAHQRKKRWYRFVTCLAAVVVFCTTYALILPAITLEKKCEIPEHTHTDACYIQPEAHTHTDACYTQEQGNLICTKSTEPAHVQSDDR